MKATLLTIACVFGLLISQSTQAAASRFDFQGPELRLQWPVQSSLVTAPRLASLSLPLFSATDVPFKKPDPNANYDWAGWTLIGVGVVCMGAGGFMTYKSFETADKTPDTDVERDALNDEIFTYQLSSGILYGLGGLSVAGGLLILLWPDDAPPPVELGAVPGGAVLAWHGTF